MDELKRQVLIDTFKEGDEQLRTLLKLFEKQDDESNRKTVEEHIDARLAELAQRHGH